MKEVAKNTRNKRVEKMQINIKWNSRLFFQIGVIASLLSVFFIMQTDFEKKVAIYKPITSNSIEEPPFMHYVVDVDKPKTIEKTKVVQKKQPLQTVVKSNSITIKPNDTPEIETSILPTDAPVFKTPVTIINNQVDSKPEPPKSMMNVEFVPVFPGCESLDTNAEKVECMSSKINSFINRNFRKEVLENLNANETYRIYVNFKIDSNGFVTDVVASSHNNDLKKEAQRVINNLPTMKPGKQGIRNVDVLYTIPIIFKIK